jgi:hypothetical protein
MDEFERQVEPEHDLTVLRSRGRLRRERLVERLKDFYVHHPTRRLLWDLTDASLADLTREDAKAILATAMAHCDSRRAGRTAIVAPGDLEFGMCRMYGIFAELRDHPVAHGVFRGEAEARAWLLADEPDAPAEGD